MSESFREQLEARNAAAAARCNSVSSQGRMLFEGYIDDMDGLAMHANVDRYESQFFIPPHGGRPCRTVRLSVSPHMRDELALVLSGKARRYRLTVEALPEDES